MTTTRPARPTGSLGTLVLGAYRFALRARLQRRRGAALLERPLRALAATITRP